MPSKGSSRAHETFRINPAGSINGDSGGTGVGGDPQLDGLIDDMANVNVDTGDVGLVLERHDLDNAAHQSAMRRWLAEQGPDEWTTIQVSGATDGGLESHVYCRVRHVQGLHYEVARDIDEPPYVASVRNSMHATLEGRRDRPSSEELDDARGTVASQVAEEHANAEALRRTAGDRTPDCDPWVEDRAEFQSVYEDTRRQAEEAGTRYGIVPFYRENATGGLGARDGGRSFGFEIEFDFPSSVDRRQALAAIGRDLHAAGLTNHPGQDGYHHNRRGFDRWRFERDGTVAGEIVSPICYDEPQTWDQLATVCEIVRRHGGQANARTGGHVHVGCHDYDHLVDNHHNLLGVTRAHEDTLYRLAQNPTARAHRGLAWCAPNVNYGQHRSIDEVRARHSSHQVGTNFESVQGRGSDHVEFRMFDGSLDPGVIQTQINLSLGLTDAALRSGNNTTWDHEPLGTHRTRNQHLTRGQRLTGDDWDADTHNFRQLMDRVFHGRQNRQQAAALFALTRWQRPRR